MPPMPLLLPRGGSHSPPLRSRLRPRSRSRCCCLPGDSQPRRAADRGGGSGLRSRLPCRRPEPSRKGGCCCCGFLRNATHEEEATLL
jgi:hypothetical protein